MELVPGTDGTWNLVDEKAPVDARLIAIIRSPVEAMALKRLCEMRIGDAALSPYGFSLGNRTYTVTPYSDRAARLSLRIEGDDGSLHRVETEFKASLD